MNPIAEPLQKKTSFYYPFLLLPRGQRRALETLYRFCWATDEISDSSDPLPLKKKKFQKIKKDLTHCFKGKPQGTLFQGLTEVIQHFHLSKEPLFRVLAGVERDLKPIRFKKFLELHHYALQVAGGPGLASMEIFGFKDKAHRNYAENLGVFLQIVNMMRDFKEDMSIGRQYFPDEDFKRFHLNPSHIEENNSHWKPFVEFQLNRAWIFLEKARQSLSRGERSHLATAEAIAAVYVKLCQKLRAHPHRILQGPTRLSKADKLLSVAGAVGRCFLWKWMEN